MLISNRRMILKNSSPRIWSRQTVEQYIAIYNYCSGQICSTKFSNFLGFPGSWSVLAPLLHTHSIRCPKLQPLKFLPFEAATITTWDISKFLACLEECLRNRVRERYREMLSHMLCNYREMLGREMLSVNVGKTMWWMIFVQRFPSKFCAILIGWNDGLFAALPVLKSLDWAIKNVFEI